MDSGTSCPASLSDATLLRESSEVGAVCVNAHVRICAGGGLRRPSLPRRRTELVWKCGIRLGCKALRLKAKEANPIEKVQLPKELKNRVNDFNNLHNPFFEFLVLRQGRASAWPVGKLAVVKASPSRLPADYCQRGLPFTSSGRRTEFVWKRDMRSGCKALRLKAKHANQIPYCQLGKMAVVVASIQNKACGRGKRLFSEVSEVP